MIGKLLPLCSKHRQKKTRNLAQVHIAAMVNICLPELKITLIGTLFICCYFHSNTEHQVEFQKDDSVELLHNGYIPTYGLKEPKRCMLICLLCSIDLLKKTCLPKSHKYYYCF